MKDIVDRELEARLRALPPVPVPEGLRDRVLAAARSHRAGKAWTTPRQRLWLTACAAALLLIFVGEGVVSNVQRTRLVTLSGSMRPAASRPDDQNALLAEVLGGGAVPRLEAAALGSPEPRGATGRRGPEPRIHFGSSVSEDPEIEFFMEGSHDSPKNLH
jgi:hypothetical protein